MRLFFESGEYDLETQGEIPLGSQALETIGIVRSWESQTQVYTINTSGTTGEYKSIELDRDLMEWSARQTAAACRLGADEKEFCCLPINKVGGMMQIIRALVFDRPLFVVDPLADPMIKLDSDHDYTLTSLTPYQFYHIFQSDESLNKLSKFKVVLIGGGPVSVDLEEKIKSFEKWVETRFYHTYGMTETASHIALRPIENQDPENSFHALPGVKISKAEDDCLIIDIPQLERSIETHDMIQLNRHGFSFIGRKDNIINSGGLKIIPERIERNLEKALFQMGLNIPLYLRGDPDEALGQKCVLVIEEKNKSHSDVLQKLIRETIESYQRPKEIRYLKHFKYTRTNKIIRQ